MPNLNPLQQFATHFENLTDPRMARTRRHLLTDLLVIDLCAMIANASTWVDIENVGNAKRDLLRRFLELPNGIPSYDTFGRVFARLDPAALLVCLQHWLSDLRHQLGGQHVAIDGKTLRGSHDGDTRPNALHLVSAWATEARLFLG
jgi:DDE_Tnp_1-associated